MKNSAKGLVSIALLSTGIIFLYIYLKNEIRYFNFDISRILQLVLSCAFVYASGRILSGSISKKARKIIMKMIAVYMLALYTFLIVNLTLIDPRYGRYPSNVLNWNFALLKSYFSSKMNLKPFKTIKLFYNGWVANRVSFKDMALNLIGNFLAFMPLSLLLPLVSNKMRKAFHFTIAVAGVIITIEILQFVLRSGFCDIDDFILNLAGSICAYGFLRIPPIRKVVNEKLLLEY
ncbi:MAG: VanZ family protein [Eubacteriaceae bacterium]|nr:VanZ family protein [Eubacteriaceae bacterium]